MKTSRRRKHQEQPKEKNSDLKTQKLKETTQQEELRKTENCRAWWRREIQLTTAAPLESSTLRSAVFFPPADDAICEVIGRRHKRIPLQVCRLS